MLSTQSTLKIIIELVANNYLLFAGIGILITIRLYYGSKFHTYADKIVNYVKMNYNENIFDYYIEYDYQFGKESKLRKIIRGVDIYSDNNITHLAKQAALYRKRIQFTSILILVYPIPLVITKELIIAWLKRML